MQDISRAKRKGAAGIVSTVLSVTIGILTLLNVIVFWPAAVAVSVVLLAFGFYAMISARRSYVAVTTKLISPSTTPTTIEKS
jgi:hypothetical protein